jgi:CRP-like cAMP-binding protein
MKTWEIVRTTKRIKYKVQELGKGSIFGHEEILLDIPRYHTIKALEEVEVFYLNKEKFLEILEEVDLKTLKKLVAPMDVEKIARSILNIKTVTKFRVYYINCAS